jgi:phytoene dehydrogenase-like protein
VHLGADDQELAVWSAALSSGRTSPHTFMLLGQMAQADPSRAPAGGETVWAYSHLPKGSVDGRSVRRLADRIEASLEAHAPGFGERVTQRLVQTPSDLERDDRKPRQRRGERRDGAALPATGVRPVPGWADQRP